MSETLGIAAHRQADGVYLVAEGEIDCASAPAFVAGLLSAIADTDGIIVVDLGAVTFIDSSGLAALLEAQESADGRLRLGTLHPTVRRLLEISGLLKRFPRSEDLSGEDGVDT